jgi:zinc transport system substrate-binding protein
LLGAVVGCAENPDETRADESSHSLQVAVSILPQAWFVEQIGGSLVEVIVLVGPGHSPATYEPTARQMTRLQNADLLLTAAVPFERGLIPRLAAMSQAPPVVGPRPSTSAGHHHHDGLDPHTWLDPEQAAAMADTICRHLSRLASDHAGEFSTRRDTLQARLAALRTEVRTLLTPFAGREFFVFHPAFGHFARAFGLVQIAIEADGHEPGARQLAEVIERARNAQAGAVIVQPQFSRNSAEAVAEAIPTRIVVLDPLAADYPDNLRHIARTMVEVFTAATPLSGEGATP